MPKDFADSLRYEPWLDGIGPARYVDQAQLPDLNKAMDGIRILP